MTEQRCILSVWSQIGLPEQTVAQIAARYEVYPGQIQALKKALLEGASGVFNGNNDYRQKGDDALVARLYQQIGKLKVERYFGRRGSVHEPGAAAGDGGPAAPSLVHSETVCPTEH